MDKNVKLPKWPAMVVEGRDITPEQAASIILRTDSALTGYYWNPCNNEYFCDRLRELFNIPDSAFPDFLGDWEAIQRIVESWQMRMGTIPLEFLPNHRIAYAGDEPHGWCDWNGKIGCNYYSIGKWPTVDTVKKEWRVIAQAFPFLSLTCTLYYEKYYEKYTDYGLTPLVQYVIKNGVIYTRLPKDPPRPLVKDPLPLIPVLSEEGEIGISIEDLSAKLVQVYGRNWPKMYDDPHILIS